MADQDPNLSPHEPDAAERRTATDDRVRRDGGKSTDDKTVPPRELAKMAENAREHSKDEPGS